MNSKDKLLQDVEEFLKRAQMSKSSFGINVMNDHHLVRDLRKGRNITMKTASAILDYIYEYELLQHEENGEAA